jgi:hypothetical protein
VIHLRIMRQRILVLGAASSISLMLGLNVVALATIGQSAGATSQVFTMAVPVPPRETPSVPPQIVATTSTAPPTTQARPVVPTTVRAVSAAVASVAQRVVTTTTRVTAAVQSVTLGGIWACIRRLESGNNYAANTGNGYYGAYQFLASTWNSASSGAGYRQYANGRADLAPPAVQDAAAVWLQAHSGWGQWSTASRCGA